jgi:hypothetical protein
MAQAIDKELHDYIMMLNASQKKSILKLIKSFIQPVEKEQRISREQYNKEIKEAEERIEAGHYITMEELEKDAATW